MPGRAIPKGQWWAYQRYAALSGRLVATTPSGKIDLVASRDDGGQDRPGRCWATPADSRAT